MITLSIVLLCLAGALAEELPRPLPGTAPASAGEAGSRRFITIDFDNVDIQLFIKYISELSGKNFIVDKSVQGNITIISPTKLSEEEAYQVFESVLEVYGFTTVESGSVVKILPAARARSQNVEMLRDGVSNNPEDRVVTQLVALKYSSPEDIKKVLTPLVSPSSVLIAHVPSGMLIITETQSNVQKLLGIIEVLDVQSREEEVAVIPLKNGSAASLGKMLSALYQKGSVQKKAGEGGLLAIGEIKVVPYERVNALIVSANSSDMGRIKSLIELLDMEVERSEGNIHVYYLQNATAVELAKVLSTLPEKQQTDEENKAKAASVSKDVRIMADEETNSLVITSSKDDYAVLEDIIKKLDIPRRMVYLEALIMEVDADKAFDVGVQWAAGGTFSEGTGTLISGFSGAAGYNMLAGISSDDPVLLPGYSLGVLKQGIRIGNVTFPNIAAILKAYKTDSEINIISTPQVLTTDNKKAQISVGENVPYITSRNTTSGNQDYTQYEYKDVATKLSIVPHINQADTMRLEIETEVVRIKDNTADTPTTYKRTASTTVILNDKDTVVIGGIIGQDDTESEWKIPLLGDIPVLGWLFKTHTTNSTKTNMFIFITPRIIRNPADLATVSLGKEEVMRETLPSVKELVHKEDNPAHAAQLITMGYEKLQAGQLQEAGNYFAEALRIDPLNPFALVNMGGIYEREGNSDLARKMYQAVIAGGSDAIADKSSDPQQKGTPLLELAREGLERIDRKEPAADTSVESR
jgi:general secretion pathway protein D